MRKSSLCMLVTPQEKGQAEKDINENNNDRSQEVLLVQGFVVG